MKHLNSKILSNKIKIESLKMVFRSGGSHIGSALSYIDILSVLYSMIMSFDPKNPEDPERDKFILSKGHGCASLYACLAIIGFFDLNKLKTYGKNGSSLMNRNQPAMDNQESARFKKLLLDSSEGMSRSVFVAQLSNHCESERSYGSCSLHLTPAVSYVG